MSEDQPARPDTTFPCAVWNGHASDSLDIADPAEGLSITFSGYFFDEFVNIEVVGWSDEPSDGVKMLSLDRSALEILIAWATKMREKIMENQNGKNRIDRRTG